MERNKDNKDKNTKEEKKKEDKKELKQTPKKSNSKNVLKDFIDGIQAVKKIEDKDAFKTVDKLCQLTWNVTKQPKAPVFAHLAVNVLLGNIGIKHRKTLSDNCVIYQVKSNTGKYSCKVICEIEPFKPSKDGVWGVNPLSFHKLK